MSVPAKPGPITVALVDDYDVVLVGVAYLFDRYADRIVIAEIGREHGVCRPSGA